MKKWEYHHDYVEFDEWFRFEQEMNKLGLDGWELVQVDINRMAGYPSKYSFEYILKREIHEAGES